MTEVFLLAALVIAITFDVIRVYQYIQMRKIMNEEEKKIAKGLVAERIIKLKKQYDSQGETHEPFEFYLIRNWDL